MKKRIRKSLLPILLFSIPFGILKAQEKSTESNTKQLDDVEINAKAAKLPNVQKISIHTPPDLKIDGNTTDWKNQFHAYNHALNVFYTIANDENNIYLVIQATDTRIINKMMEGGISFTVSPSGIKKEESSVTILFPLLTITECGMVLHAAGKTINDNPRNFSHAQSEATVKALSDPVVSIEKANKMLKENLQAIKIAGIPAITDTLDRRKVKNYIYLPLRFHPFKFIPVDNKDSIKAITYFTAKGAYNYELAVPMKYLGLPDNAQRFTYNIKMNGRGEDKRLGNFFLVKEKGVLINEDLETTTDFWAEYVLAKE